MSTFKTALVLTVVARVVAAQNNSLDASFAASTRASTAQTTQSSGQSSQASSTGTLIVLGAGLLAGVGGGITTTMYRKKPAPRVLPQPLPQEPVAPPQEPPPLPPPSGPVPTEPTPPPPPPMVKAPSLDAMVMARAWLLANEVQLKQDLALGAGPAIDDLAGLARIAPERRAHFARLLQRNRKVLLAPHDVTPQQAAELMSRVGDLVLANPLLRPDGEAALASR